MSDAVEELAEAVTSGGVSVIGSLNNEWAKYQKLMNSIKEAARCSPYITDNQIKRLEKFALELRDRTGIYIIEILGAIEHLVRVGNDKERIEKVISVAAEMSIKGKMNFIKAVRLLYQTLVLETDGLVHIYPGLAALSATELAQGKAIDCISETLKC